MQQWNYKRVLHFNLFDYGLLLCVRVNNDEVRTPREGRSDSKLEKVTVITLPSFKLGKLIVE